MAPKPQLYSVPPENSEHSAANTGSGESSSRAASLFHDAYLTVPRPEQLPKSTTGIPANAEKTQWTMAIDLAASQDGAEGGGALNQQKRLNAIAEKTRGVNVAIVVQVVHPEHHSFSETLKSATFGAKDAPPLQPPLERFIIRNGTVTKLGETTTSKGYSQDLSDLLQVANQQAPSQKLGLIVQSHGGASDGLEGDDG